MSPTPSESIPLRAVAADPETQITVTDGNFREVARGVGRLEESLAPGIYSVEFRAWDAAHTEYALLQPGGGPVTIEGPALDFTSALPIGKTRTTREYHSGPAQRMSASRPTRAPLDYLGPDTSSGLLLFARDVEPRGRPRNPAKGVSLLAPDGTVLLELDRDSEHSIEERWAGERVDVPPGTYGLRVRTNARGPLFMSVVASAGWQSQIYLLQRDYRRRDGGTVRRADPFNASILMVRYPEGEPPGFDPDGEELRRTELARLSLADPTWKPRGRDLRDFLWSKYQNPMLGIFGAHLLLRQPEPDLDYLGEVTHNLSGLVPEHPDVVALRLALDARRGTTTPTIPSFEHPPMLQSSWQIVVEQSARYPSLVPAGSLAARIPAQLYSEGIWLIWGRLPGRLPPPADLDRLPLLLDLIRARVPDRPAKIARERELRLGTVEQGLLRYLVGVNEQLDPSRSARWGYTRKRERTVGELLAPAALVRALGVPLVTVRHAMTGLERRLTR